MASTVTRSVEVDCPAEALFDFLNDPRNWPRYAIHNIRAIEPGEDGFWIMDTPRGPGKLRLMTNREFGILDHQFIDAKEDVWTVPARVVPAGDGCVFLMTLTQPDGLPDAAFSQGLELLDNELKTLKGILES